MSSRPSDFIQKGLDGTGLKRDVPQMEWFEPTGQVSQEQVYLVGASAWAL